jgi:hypothetical protein
MLMPSRQPSRVFSLVAALFAAAGCALAADKAPASYEVHHHPLAPRSGENVRVTAQVPQEVTQLVLRYQVVDPGAYIELNSPAFRANWQAVPMEAAKKSAQTSLFTAELPSTLQTNRRLIRYRFLATEASGRTFTIPTTNDVFPNFAYFVYDGVPAWRGAINPRSGDPAQRTPVTFETNVMQRVQSYFLIAKRQSVRNATWVEQNPGKEYRYTGTLVADGVAYDHVKMRARGGVWRYMMGKNMWKFDFSHSQRFEARDDYGNPYPVTWNKINLRSCIQQADYGHRGEQGMFEAVGFRLFNLAGVAAPFTHWIQLRIVDGPQENPADQYDGDFWGLYLAIENEDGRFLKAHGLPDGNLYKMEMGQDQLSHHGAGQVTNHLDLDRFVSAYSSTRQPEAWWRAQLNLPAYFSYRAVCECIHHYDLDAGKNYDYYLNPTNRRWQVIPWDIDLTWADTMFGRGEEPFKRRVLIYPAFQLEYQNRVREIRDLLFNPGETGRLIDECAAIIADPTGGPSPTDADRAKWDYHPMMRGGMKAGQGLFYQIPPTHDFRGMVRLMKNYVNTRGATIDRFLLRDPGIPATPAATYAGPPNFPSSGLTFRASEYQGESAFAAMRWRLAEIAPPAVVHGRPVSPGKYEITPVWESGELASDGANVTLPAKSVIPGHTYRARVRMKDVSGRWSHWSPPVEFVVGGEKS